MNYPTREQMTVNRFLITLLLVSSFGCMNSRPATVHPDQIEAAAGANAIAQNDLNKDTVLDATELEKLPGLKAAVNQVDANHDGKIVAEEIQTRIQTWRKSGVGRMTVACTVLQNQQPVANAIVKFVPEKFLGTGLPTAQGTTDAQGQATIAAPGEVGGVSPGFYRVEITSAQAIPAKYNTETTLGVEIAADNIVLLNGVLQFEIK
jgi:hypothetical protein